MADRDRDEAMEEPAFSLDLGVRPDAPRRARGHYLPRDWVERTLTTVHKPDEGVIVFFRLGQTGQPEAAVCPVCKITWQYREGHGWENSR